ncbi:hypothetical protein HID58_013593 [Brassica napus]|uniref:Uncharacterized protein n=1 Tax=Brassica napus TaxID=3708 RepID=A0ABQ8E4B6_BRANA|nr:hypothetical protein HID58_013593 [Brassica napus]
MLSKGTHYSVYLVFKRASSRSYGFDHTPIETEVGFTGKEVRKTRERESGGNVEEPKERSDKWSEVKLGSFYIDDGGCDDGDEVEVAIMETRMGQWKSGLVFQGIEIRPVKEEEVTK